MICKINVNFGEKSQLSFFVTADKELDSRYFGIYFISNNEKYIANCRIEAAIRRRYMSCRLKRIATQTQTHTYNAWHLFAKAIALTISCSENPNNKQERRRRSKKIQN